MPRIIASNPILQPGSNQVAALGPGQAEALDHAPSNPSNLVATWFVQRRDASRPHTCNLVRTWFQMFAGGMTPPGAATQPRSTQL
jgi:hypothetical protein